MNSAPNKTERGNSISGLPTVSQNPGRLARGKPDGQENRFTGEKTAPLRTPAVLWCHLPSLDPSIADASIPPPCAAPPPTSPPTMPTFNNYSTTSIPPSAPTPHSRFELPHHSTHKTSFHRTDPFTNYFEPVPFTIISVYETAPFTVAGRT